MNNDELELNLIDTDTINLATFLVSELQANSPYKTGNMQRSIALLEVNNSAIDIIISVDYASYVNNQTKHYHWIEKVIDRCTRSYSQNNINDDINFNNYMWTIK